MTNLTAIVAGLPAMAAALQGSGRLARIVEVGATSDLRRVLQSGELTPGVADKVFIFADSTPVDTPQDLPFLLSRLVGMGAAVIVVATSPAARDIVQQCPGAGLLEGPLKLNQVLGAISGLPQMPALEPVADNVPVPLPGEELPAPAAPAFPAGPAPAFGGASPFTSPAAPESPAPAAEQPAPAFSAPAAEPDPQGPSFGQGPASGGAPSFGAPAAEPQPAEQPAPGLGSAPAFSAPSSGAEPEPQTPPSPSGQGPAFGGAPSFGAEPQSAGQPGTGFATQPSFEGEQPAFTPEPNGQAPFGAQPFGGQQPPASPFGSAPVEQPAPAFGGAPAFGSAQGGGFGEQPAPVSRFAAAAAQGGFGADPAVSPAYPASSPAFGAGPAAAPAFPGATGAGPAWGESTGAPVARVGAPPTERPARKGHVITVTAPKGGTGKSSLSLNLAAYLGLRLRGTGKNVCIVDANVQQADTGKYLNAYTPNIEGILKDTSSIHPDRINQYLLHRPELNMSALLGPTTVEAANPQYFTGKRYSQILDALKPNYDYIVIDTPVAELYHDIFRHFALPRADFIVVAAAPNATTLINTDMWLRQVTAPRQADGMGIDPDKIGIVLNRAQDDIGMDVEEAQRELGRWKFLGSIPETKEWQRCNNDNELVATKNYHELNEAFSRVLAEATGEEMLRTTDSAIVPTRGNGGLSALLTRFFGRKG